MINPLQRSLEAKILILVMGIVTIGFGIFAVFDVSRDSSDLHRQKEESTDQLSASVVGSIQNTMLAGKGQVATSAIDKLRTAPEVDRIQVYSNKGNEVFSDSGVQGTANDSVNSVLSTGTPAQYYEDRSDGHYLVQVRPLPTEAACLQCHSDGQPLRGAVLVATSMTNVQQAVQDDIIRMAAVFITGIITLLVVLWFALRATVLKPLRHVVGVIHNIADGDLSERVTVSPS
ncbi:MAG: hypothetical protein M1539_00435, partial [Actinobacteria bacterium]|nr:hypothetical protein [Actinomycetota bacterium]